MWHCHTKIWPLWMLVSKQAYTILITANYEPKDVAMNTRHGLIKSVLNKLVWWLLLGCGFDPGVTQVHCLHVNKHHFDEMHYYLDIIDCNAGDYLQLLILTSTLRLTSVRLLKTVVIGKNGEWVEIPPMSIHKALITLVSVQKNRMYCTMKSWSLGEKLPNN